MPFRRKDAYYRRAKAEGFRARSAFKLIELNQRFGLLPRDAFVVDLGAWPGGWLQVALDRVGPRGRVVGLDIVPITPLEAVNATVVVGDVRDPAAIATVRERLRRPADVVLSDLAPKLSGVRTTDEAHAAELVEATLSALPTLLKPGGRLLLKLFMGGGYKQILASTQKSFAEVRTVRPQATRRGSTELYLVASGYRGGCL